MNVLKRCMYTEHVYLFVHLLQVVCMYILVYIVGRSDPIQCILYS